MGVLALLQTEFNSSLSVLVCSGCRNNISLTVQLEQWKFISHSSGGEKSGTRVPAWLGSGENSLPDL